MIREKKLSPGRKKTIRESTGRKVFVVWNYLFFLLLILICAFPLYYILVQSLSGSIVAGKGILVPYRFTFSNYRDVFRMEGILDSLLISVSRTVIGTVITVFCCMLMGYLFTKEELPGRRFFYRMVTVTMYVSGGIIPTFLVIRMYGLINSFWVYVLPTAVSAYYIILIKTYIEGLPSSVEESAMLDGAGPMTIFLRIIMPMSLPIAATIAVYASVYQWNSWFDNHIYTFTNNALTTMQYKLYKFLNQAERLAEQIESMSGDTSRLDNALTPQGVRMTVTVVAVIPVMMIYPFLQRYFIKGINIGAVKG
ncbi:MAG: carbohydrate ABC transporter permease [Clostridia bacterium]|nr:carbohydrate ABC transporter permease [Clostridia bacterium]